MHQRKLRVALIGCGQIADAHLQEIAKIGTAQAVAVCDRYVDLAEQAARRFEVPRVFTDAGQMLESVRPDVVHITTPPHSHRALALQALAAGAHVYMEKPFTIDAAEARIVLDAAHAAGRLICVGHDHLYDPVWDTCRRMHGAGELGDVVHIDSIQGYDLNGPFGRVLSTDRDHWVHRLPGGLFHNTVSHPLYKITDFLHDEDPRIWATWFDGQGRGGMPSELRVMLQGNDVTANLVFSSRMRPVQRVVRVYGTKQNVEVDQDGGVVRAYGKITARGPFAKIQVPLRQLLEARRTLLANVRSFLRGEIHFFAGMNRLFGLFYDAILNDGPCPIAPGEIYRVTAILDRIFEQCRSEQGSAEPSRRLVEPQAAPAARRATVSLRTKA